MRVHSPHVALHITILYTSVRADGASIRLLSSMDAVMSQEVALVREYFATDRARHSSS